MKRAIRWILILGAIGFVIAVVRNKVVPRPEPPLPAPPPFRPGGHHAPQQQPSAGEPSSTDDLTEVKGIGPVYSERLRDLGITTFAGLAGANAPDIAGALDVSEATVSDWQGQARDLGS